MVHIRNRDIKALRRRRDFLMKRIVDNRLKDEGFSFDVAEMDALNNVLEMLEEERGDQENHVLDQDE